MVYSRKLLSFSSNSQHIRNLPAVVVASGKLCFSLEIDEAAKKIHASLVVNIISLLVLNSSLTPCG